MKKQLLFLTAILIVIGCKTDHSLTKQQFGGNAIGTYYAITLYSDQKQNITPQVDSIVEVFNQSMSTWRKNSLINQLNHHKDSIKVGPTFAHVFKESIRINTLTEGYFDPTVGNLVNAYGFGAQGEKDRLPSLKKRDSLMNLVGIDLLKIAPTTVKDSVYIIKKKPGVYLEFNAIGKGTLVDAIAQYLQSINIEDFIIDVGGEVYAHGKNKTRESPWYVGIEDPKKKEKGEQKSITVVGLTNKAMAGSGNYRKFKVDSITNKEFVHTINPKTGDAYPSSVVGVNVIASTCTEADAFATAFMAMPLEESKRILPNMKDIHAVVMYLDDHGMLRFVYSDGFKEYISK